MFRALEWWDGWGEIRGLKESQVPASLSFPPRGHFRQTIPHVDRPVPDCWSLQPCCLQGRAGEHLCV